MTIGDGPCESIRVAQEHLNTLTDMVLEVDGLFGEETKAAVQEFQRDNGLNPDGLLGPNTWARILEEVGAS